MNKSEKKAEWNRLSILSLILSVGVIIPLLNNIIGMIAAYTGIKALMEIRDSKKKEKGKYLALAGLVIGCLPYWFILTTEIQKLGMPEYQFNLITLGISIILISGAALLMRKFKLL